MTVKCQQVAVRIGDNELLLAVFNLASLIPTHLQWNHQIEVGLPNASVDRVNIFHFDLEIRASTIGVFKRGGPKPSPRPGCFFQHKVNAVEIEIGKSLLGPVEQDAEPEHLDVKGQGPAKIRDIKFGCQSAHRLLPYHKPST